MLFSTRKYLLVLAAIFTVLVSFGIFVSLIVRESIGVDPGNVLVLVVTAGATLTAYYSARHPVRFFTSYIVFVLSIAPTIFGWIIFLYLPSLLLLTVVAVLMPVQLIATRFHKQSSSAR